MDEAANISLNSSQILMSSPNNQNESSFNSSKFSPSSSHTTVTNRSSISPSPSFHLSLKTEKNSKEIKQEEGCLKDPVQIKSGHYLHNILDIQSESNSEMDGDKYQSNHSENMIDAISTSKDFLNPLQVPFVQHLQFTLNRPELLKNQNVIQGIPGMLTPNKLPHIECVVCYDKSSGTSLNILNQKFN